MADLKQVNEALNFYLRPSSFPVAVKLCESEKELPEKVRIPQKDLGLTISLCHAIALARRYGWTVAVDKNQSCYVAGLSLVSCRCCQMWWMVATRRPSASGG
jgi:uncharacterized protein (DUF169 family)